MKAGVETQDTGYLVSRGVGRNWKQSIKPQSVVHSDSHTIPFPKASSTIPISTCLDSKYSNMSTIEYFPFK